MQVHTEMTSLKGRMLSSEGLDGSGPTHKHMIMFFMKEHFKCDCVKIA